jgi:hypothetical protein
MRSGEWTLQLNSYQICWETSNTKYGQKRPKIATDGRNLASLLLWLYWPVRGHNFWMPHSIWLLVFALTLLDLYLDIFWGFVFIMPRTGARTKSSEWYVLCFRGSWVRLGSKKGLGDPRFSEIRKFLPSSTNALHLAAAHLPLDLKLKLFPSASRSAPLSTL